MVPTKAAVEAEGPQVVQVPPVMPRPATLPSTDEIVLSLSYSPPPALSPPLAAPERLPGGSVDVPPASGQPAEGTAGGPSTSERLPEETVGGSPVPSPLRSTRALAVARTLPCKVPEENVQVGTSAKLGGFEFVDEQEEDVEMMEFKKLISISPARLFFLNFRVCSLIFSTGRTEGGRGSC